MLRSQAQETLAQGEELREEAQRVGEAAWRAFDRGFATNISGFAHRRARVREIDQSRRTQAELQRNVHKKAWEAAETTRETSTIQALKAFNALAMVADQVEKELAEVANLPKLAETLKLSAQEELGCAQAVNDELMLLGREALNQLDLTPTSSHEYGSEGIPPVSFGDSRPGTQGRALGDGGPGFDPGPQPLTAKLSGPEQMPGNPAAGLDSLSWEVKEIPEAPVGVPAEPAPDELGESPLAIPIDSGASAEPTGPIPFAPRPPVSEMPEIVDAASLDEAPSTDDESSAMGIQPPPAPSSSTQDVNLEMLEGRAFDRSSQSPASPSPKADIPELDHSEMNQPPVPVERGIVDLPVEAATASPPPLVPPAAAAARSSVADQLIREMEAARIAGQARQAPPSSGSPTAAQDLIREMQEFRSSPVSQDPPSATGKPYDAVYFERVFLMFPSTLTPDEVGLVWAAVEDAAQGSRILDSRLLPASAGIQFTVQLGRDGLLAEDLKSRLSGAEFEGLEPDRLKVDWPKR